MGNPRSLAVLGGLLAVLMVWVMEGASFAFTAASGKLDAYLGSALFFFAIGATFAIWFATALAYSYLPKQPTQKSQD